MYDQPVEQETGYCGMLMKYNVFIQWEMHNKVLTLFLFLVDCDFLKFVLGLVALLQYYPILNTCRLRFVTKDNSALNLYLLL